MNNLQDNTPTSLKHSKTICIYVPHHKPHSDLRWRAHGRKEATLANLYARNNKTISRWTCPGHDTTHKQGSRIRPQTNSACLCSRLSKRRISIDASSVPDLITCFSNKQIAAHRAQIKMQSQAQAQAYPLLKTLSKNPLGKPS